MISFHIYCSAGVGRTGTFIALDYLLEQAKVEGEIDVYSYSCIMRSNRVNMIQTLVSLVPFVFPLANQYILSSLSKSIVPPLDRRKTASLMGAG